MRSSVRTLAWNHYFANSLKPLFEGFTACALLNTLIIFLIGLFLIQLENSDSEKHRLLSRAVLLMHRAVSKSGGSLSPWALLLEYSPVADIIGQLQVYSHADAEEHTWELKCSHQTKCSCVQRHTASHSLSFALLIFFACLFACLKQGLTLQPRLATLHQEDLTNAKVIGIRPLLRGEPTNDPLCTFAYCFSQI